MGQIGPRAVGYMYLTACGVKNPKIGKVKTDKQITYHVTAPMSGQFLKSRSDRSSLAKLPHRVLQKYPVLQWKNGQNKPENQQN